MKLKRLWTSYSRMFNDKFQLKSRKKSIILILFLAVVLIILIFIKKKADNEVFDLSEQDYDETEQVLNKKFNLYELNKTLYPVKRDFKAQIDQMYKLVHLDLKGSPPKLQYLKNLINYFKKIGITGVLIEYEDMFPYSQGLSPVANRNAYKREELEEVLELLTRLNILIIPLIQTYGHLEFVLKLDEFKHLREIKHHYQVITPCLEESYDKVIFPMIDQMLEVHPKSLQYIHIGCDEVYHVGKHQSCEAFKLNTIQDYFVRFV
jgi:hypothetical protein